MIFVQMADGVDDETWMHHLKAHDYSRWMREAIERRYTAPAGSPEGAAAG